VKTTRYPDAGAGVAEVGGEALALVEVVSEAGAELQAERMPMRKIKTG